MLGSWQGRSSADPALHTLQEAPTSPGPARPTLDWDQATPAMLVMSPKASLLDEETELVVRGGFQGYQDQTYPKW